MRAKRVIAGLIVVTALCAGGTYSRARWLPAAGRWLDVGKVPRRMDYVMSLPGDENYRPFLAAAMINAHLADQALIVQNEPSPAELDGVAVPTSEVLRRVYRFCEVPESKLIVLSGKSVSTAGDIGALAEFLQSHPQATVAIVTSDYHTRRARWTIRQQLGQLAARTEIVSAPNGEFDFGYWWQTEEGFVSVITEYVKLMAYAILYGRVVWWLGIAMAVILLWRLGRRVVSRSRPELKSVDNLSHATA